VKELEAERFIDGPGIVDYVTGAMPGPGVFVLGTIEHPQQRHYLNLYKLGEGPLYCFHTPYHLFGRDLIQRRAERDLHLCEAARRMQCTGRDGMRRSWTLWNFGPPAFASRSRSVRH
jgi:hypothetical protein